MAARSTQGEPAGRRPSWQRPQVHLAVPVRDGGAEPLPLVRLDTRRTRRTARPLERASARPRRTASSASASPSVRGSFAPSPGDGRIVGNRRPAAVPGRSRFRSVRHRPENQGVGEIRVHAGVGKLVLETPGCGHANSAGAVVEPPVGHRRARTPDVPVAGVAVYGRKQECQHRPGVGEQSARGRGARPRSHASSGRPGSAKTFSPALHRRQIVVAAVRHRCGQMVWARRMP